MSETDPKAAAIAEWEARRHASEVAYWVAHLDEFVARLPNIRRNRLGDLGAARMVDDVLAALAAAQGEEFASGARERLQEGWTDRREAGEKGP